MAELIPDAQPSMPNTLVGREREFERLHALLAVAAEGQGRIAAVTGAAGIGKTALVGALIATAERRGFRTLLGGCYDGITTTPYHPWFAALTYQRDRLAIQAHDLLGYITEALPDQAAVDDDGMLAQAVHRLLALEARAQPVLLVLEDLHWADAATVELVLRIAPVIARLPVLVIVTLRDEEAAARRLPAPLLSLTRIPTCTWLALPSLSDADIERWIAARYGLGPHLNRQVAAVVARYADGNPLFVQELTRELEQRRSLRRAGDGWQVDDLNNIAVPPVIEQLIGQRLVVLDDRTREVLNQCAVLGQVIPTALLEEVSEYNAEELSAALSRARDALILAAASSAVELEFRHALTREVIYQNVPAPKRRALHQRAAEVLLRSSQPAADQVGAHLVEAGDERAAEWLLRAGDRAERNYAWSDAIQRYERALAIDSSGLRRSRLRGWLQFRIACLLRYRDLDRARDTIDDAIESAHSADDPVLRAYGHYVRGVIDVYAKNWQRGIAELLDALELLEQLPSADRLRLDAAPGVFSPDALPLPTSSYEPDERAGPVDGPLRGDVDRRATVASFLAESGRLHDALELTLPDDGWNSAGVTQTGLMLYTSAFVHALAGRPVDSEADYERAEWAFQDEARVLIAADSMSARLSVLTWPYQADRRADRADQVARLERLGNRLGEALSPESNTALWLVYTHFLEGRWDLVAELIGAQDHGSFSGRHREHICWVAGLLARERGEPGLARRWLGVILPDSWRVEPGNSDYLSSTRAMLLASELALDAGDDAAAANWLAAHDRWRAWSGAALGASDAELIRARLERLRRTSEVARERAFLALALAVEPRQPLAQIGAQRFLAELDLDNGDVESAEDRLSRALNLADMCGVPYEALACRVVAVRLLVARQDFAGAGAVAREIRAVAEELRAVRLMELLDAIDIDPPSSERDLTARELEVLRVVAQGRTDAEVAAELYIATRTVNAHMRSIHTKLGVDSRVRAVQVARERRLI